jgi:hypothetical protein
MTLTLRRTVFSDGERRSDDYEVRCNGQTVGRIYRMRSPGRELWLWTPSYGPNGGVADTLDEAKTAFRQTWDGYGAFETACGRSPHSNDSFTNGLNGGVPDSLAVAKAGFRAVV